MSSIGQKISRDSHVENARADYDASELLLRHEVHCIGMYLKELMKLDLDLQYRCYVNTFG